MLALRKRAVHCQNTFHSRSSELGRMWLWSLSKNHEKGKKKQISHNIFFGDL